MDASLLSDDLRCLGLPEPGIARVMRAFTDDPGRAVRSGALNVSGIYPHRPHLGRLGPTGNRPSWWAR